jgi:integrase
MKLSEQLIKRKLPAKKRLEFADSDVPGLRIRLSGRTGQWSFMGRVVGVRKRASIGAWPGLSVVDARDRARQIRQDMKDGIDPTDQKRNAARAAAERQTITDLTEDYFKHLTGSAGHRKDEIRQIRHAVKELGVGHLDPARLEIDHIRRLAAMHYEHPATARHRVGAIRRFLDTLVEDRVIEANPCQLLSKKNKPKQPEPRSGVLSAREVQVIWAVCDELPDPYCDLVRFLLVVPLRRNEAGAITGEMIKDGILTLPGKTMKNGETFSIALPPQALEIVARRPAAGLLFPSRKTYMPVNGWQTIVPQLRKRCGVDFILHDIRRTFNTVLAEHEVAASVVDSLLAHRQSATRSGVVAVYNQSRLAGPRARAMRLWGSMVEAAVETGSFERHDSVVS